MRVAVLWTAASGYLNACLRELASRPGVELFVAHEETGSNAPFKEGLFSWMKDEVVWRDERDLALVQSRLTAFDPELVVVAGWHVPMYRRIMKPLKGRCLRIMTMDNCWRGSPRQWLGSLISWFYVRPIAEAAWVPGQRQASFARKFGFPVDSILQGSYACEQPEFAAIYQQRIESGAPLPHAFIFIGRLIEAKGIRTLASAYEQYRRDSEDPWPLIVCGVGPLQPLLANKAGIFLKGFIQPEKLPGELAQAGCLLLPSSFEPWALVVNEASAAGLVIVATENVGSVPHLVHNYYNGFVINPEDPGSLAQVMSRVSNMDPARQERMSRASNQLASQYTPARWADSLMDFASDRKVGQR